MSPELTDLQIHRIQESSQRRYLSLLLKFLGRLGLPHLPTWSLLLWDMELLAHLTELYEEGAHVGEAHRLLAAAAWINPLASGALRLSFPRSYAAAQGWLKVEPGVERPPLPYSVAKAIMMKMAGPGFLLEASRVLVLFESYLGVGSALLQIILPTALGQSSVVRYEEAAMFGKQLRRLSDSSMRNGTTLANRFDSSCEEIFEPLSGKLGRRKESRFSSSAEGDQSLRENFEQGVDQSSY